MGFPVLVRIHLYTESGPRLLTWLEDAFGKTGAVENYRKISNISRTLVGNRSHSDVVGASRVGAAPTTSSFSSYHMTSIDCAETTGRRSEKHLSLRIWCDLY